MSFQTDPAFTYQTGREKLTCAIKLKRWNIKKVPFVLVFTYIWQVVLVALVLIPGGEERKYTRVCRHASTRVTLLLTIA